MSVQDSINLWGAARLALAGHPVPPGTHITLTEDLPPLEYCDTCGPDPITVTIEGGGVSTVEYWSMGQVLAEILAMEAV